MHDDFWELLERVISRMGDHSQRNFALQVTDTHMRANAMLEMVSDNVSFLMYKLGRHQPPRLPRGTDSYRAERREQRFDEDFKDQIDSTIDHFAASNVKKRLFQ